jgi:uncharacterized protein
MSPERDLTRLLQAISPQLHPGVFVFCELPDHAVPKELDILLMFREDEATTVVVAQDQAGSIGLVGQFPSAWITLGATSDLEAVGFLAVLTARMAAAGISVNVVSACRHDHLFVPVAMADRAMAVLARIEEIHRGTHIGPSEETADANASVEVRPARVADAKALVALWELCGLRFDPARVKAELESCVRLHGRRGKPLGYL